MDGQFMNITHLLQNLTNFVTILQAIIQQQHSGSNPSKKLTSLGGGNSSPNLGSSLKVETKVEISTYDDQMETLKLIDWMRLLNFFY